MSAASIIAHKALVLGRQLSSLDSIKNVSCRYALLYILLHMFKIKKKKKCSDKMRKSMQEKTGLKTIYIFNSSISV